MSAEVPLPRESIRRRGLAGVVQSLLKTRSFWCWCLKGPIPILFLWVFAHQTFQTHLAESHYRIDRGEAVAYPMSDALSHFASGLAILSGDGWVNWREDSRYTVDKPGWTACLAFVTWLCKGDTARVQLVLSVVYAAVAPAVYLLISAMYGGFRARVIAFVAAILFVLYPMDRSWVCMNTMMTEGGALLLSTLGCALAVRIVSRKRWRPTEFFFLGLLLAALSLVRGQARYAAIAVLLVVLLPSFWGLRARLPSVALLLTGFLFLVGPVYLKISYHVGGFYLGTPYTSLRAILKDSEIGKKVGGANLDPDEKKTEWQAIQSLSQRADEALRTNFEKPEQVRKRAFLAMNHSFFENLSKIVRTDPKDKGFLTCMWILVLAGLAISLLRIGPAAMIPLAFAVAYLAPHLLFSHFWRRFGVPVSWLGLVYVSAVLIPLLEPEKLPGRTRKLLRYLRTPARLFRLVRYACGGERPRRARAPWPRRWFFPVVGVWILGATAALVLYDLAPLKRIDADDLLSGPRAQEILDSAGVIVDEEFRQAVADANANPEGRVRLGTAFLPFVMEPDDPVFKYPWNKRGLPPHSETYTAVYVFSPWKSPGGFRKVQYSLRGRLYDGFKQGDRVVVVLPKKKGSPYVDAILPAR